MAQQAKDQAQKQVDQATKPRLAVGKGTTGTM